MISRDASPRAFQREVVERRRRRDSTSDDSMLQIDRQVEQQKDYFSIYKHRMHFIYKTDFFKIELFLIRKNKISYLSFG